ncbi:hypothetical protein [Streptomyces sp. NBC_00354]|uniref:hypothetical protein n=1 Tax=Streptomyces sp. NBC_00354 TaxID=2975723 RepID=UPI002E256FE0
MPEVPARGACKRHDRGGIVPGGLVAQLAELVVRDHWKIEALHHARDTTFTEDAAGYGPATRQVRWPPGATSPSAPSERPG